MSAAALALLAAATAAPVGDTQYLGLWEGTVGKYPVVACFTGLGDDTVQGSYYYRSKLATIGLTRYERREGQWVESADNNNDYWTLGDVRGGTLGGRWHGKGKTLPIALKRRAYSEGEDDWGGACTSQEYWAPRAFTPRIAEKRAALGAWRYRTITFVPPAYLSDLTASTFAFASEKPGDPKIVADLRKTIPDGTWDDAAISCILAAIPSGGTDGYSDATVEPTHAGPRYIGARVTTGDFCGGAHPNYGLSFRVYDRTSGELVEPYDWFGESGFATDEYDLRTISPALRRVVMRHASRETDKECRDYLAENGSWSIGLGARGMLFAPEVAHVMTACREEIAVPWAELAPFLDADGRKARAAIEGAR